MAKVFGLFKIVGTLGGLNFYLTKEQKNVVREKPGPTAEQVKKSKNFKHTRLVNSEFGVAAGYGALLRHELSPVIRGDSDSNVSNRLQRLLGKILAADPEHAKGKRVISRQSIDQLRGFDFNVDNPYKKSFKHIPGVRIDRGNGLATIMFADVAMRSLLRIPAASSHVVLTAACVAVVFSAKKIYSEVVKGAVLGLNEKLEGNQIVVPVPGDKDMPVVVVLKATFLHKTDGVLYDISRGERNVSFIVDVSNCEL